MNRRKIKHVLAFFVLWLHLLFACCFIRDDNFSFYHYFTCCFVDRPWMSKSKVKKLYLMIFLWFDGELRNNFEDVDF